MFRQGILKIGQNTPVACIALQLRELARHGLEEILVVFSVQSGCCSLPELPVMGADTRCVLKRYAMRRGMGAGGMLASCREQLDTHFLYRDAALFFDFNCLELGLHLEASGGLVCAPRTANGTYGGTLGLSREALTYVRSEKDAIEEDLLPRLQTAGALTEPVIDRPCYTVVQKSAWPWKRPAVFFDRDGVLNKDNGFVHRTEEFEWIQGARGAVKMLNDTGWQVFVITNQSGVARGYYPESAVTALHTWMQQELVRYGAHVDAYYYCPYYAGGTVPEYTREHPDRKPSPGMLYRAMEHWPIRLEGSFLVGDKSSDMETAMRAGIPGYQFTGGDLELFIKDALPSMRP